MGIYIKLESPRRISPVEWALSRLDYCYGAIRYFHQGKIFIPRTIKIWLNAPTETLGGTLLKRPIEITNLYRDVEILRSWISQQFYQERLFASLIVFEGIWEYNNVRLAGFFSVNNEYTWRQAYYDVELDAYGKGDFDDLMDIFWKSGELENLVQSFITEVTQIAKGKRTNPTQMYFSLGAPEYGELVNLLALYLQDWRVFVSFLYSRLRRDEDLWIKNQVAPIDRRFYLRSIREQKIVQTTSRKILKESLLVERTGKSVIYIAKERDAFAKFYQRFKQEIFKPASKELPDAETLRKIMQKGLEKMEALG